MRTEDGQIISKCLNGDKAAFGFLVDKYKASVFALAYYRLRNFEDAEDITQEVLTEAYQRLHTLRRWDSFSVWLYSITSNMCKEFLRSKSRRMDREFIADQEINIMRNNSLNSYHENKVFESLREALDTLPDIYQQVLTLYYLGGMNSEEIAQAIGISPAAIRQRISRARSQLKEEVLAMMGDTFDQNKLSASFTFRIVEAIKQVRVQPVSPKALPWGMSLATGIIISFLTLGQHFNIINPTGMMRGSPLPSMTKVLKVGEIPVDVVKTSNVPILSSKMGKGKSGEPKQPNMQNTLLMAPQAEGEWAKKNDMPMGKYCSVCEVNGKIYAIGGSNWNGVFSTVEEYDPVKDVWIKKADMPTARYCLSVCVLNGKIYAIGGIADPVVFSAVEEYNPITDEWTKKANMPTPRYGLCASVVNGKIYAIGGANDPNKFWPIQAVEEYDPASDVWTKKADMSKGRAFADSSAVADKIYVIGGANVGFDCSLVEEYDPTADKWIQKKDMPTGRYQLSTCLVDGKIYAIGGRDLVDAPISNVEVYDPLTDKWTKKDNMPTKRYLLSSASVNGNIYAIGGAQNVNTALSVVEEYDTGHSGESVNSKGKLPTTWGAEKKK